MKTRQGFVSNSSTTSFSVYGIYVEDSDALMDKLMGEKKVTKTKGCKHEFDREKSKFCPECGQPAWNITEEERDPYEDLPKCLEQFGLDATMWGGGENASEGIYVGKDLRGGTFNKSKNKLEILKTIEVKLKELFPNQEPRFYSDGSYEG